MRDDQYVLNHCTPFLARFNEDSRHDFGFDHFAPGDPRGRIRESWRFPIVDTCALSGTTFPSRQELSPDMLGDAREYNDVTFVFVDELYQHQNVAILGSFTSLFEPVPLRRIQFLGDATKYLACTVAVPRRSVFYYKFVVDGAHQLDPINPQTVRLDNGVIWSRFFTWECTSLVSLQEKQFGILERLCDHILPFRTQDGQRFLSWYYDGLDAESRKGVIRNAFRLDDSAGAANYIDKILSREESHHLVDYTICLKQLERILRQREPDYEPQHASREVYVSLFKEMGLNNVNGWDTSQYGSPSHFLKLVRRHAFTGAFAHPKYGGNLSASGWSYLQSRFPFQWPRSLEFPLGTSDGYRG